jgi:hypothetical protein
MVRSSCAVVMVLVALAGCSGGGGMGELCGDHDDCASALQCLGGYCVERCDRAPECGDGYSCDDQGLCHAATGSAGAACMSEVDCGAGLSCQINGAAEDRQTRRLLATCAVQTSARPSGAPCDVDGQCRNGTCALGRCVDLCRGDRDCGTGMSCLDVPRVAASGSMFSGCLPTLGSIQWSIPMSSPEGEVLLPVPRNATSATLVMSVEDPQQRVGAVSVLSPSMARLYSLPCNPLQSTMGGCSTVQSMDQYFLNKLRHEPTAGQSVLQIPSDSNAPDPGMYRIRVSSLRANDDPGTAIPQVTAVIQFESTKRLDLHFFFLDLDDHPCMATGEGGKLDAISAQSMTSFQDVYLSQLHMVFERAGLSLGPTTYDDITDHPELDGLNVADAGKLLTLGGHATGINIYFVRSLSPIGVQAYGPNPGPAGIGGTQQSGIVIGLDTLCYRKWTDLARLTAHEVARYMGLYHNVELDTEHHPTWRDPIGDSDDSNKNLMYFSEMGGSELSPGQSSLLLRSAVLR